ncbi:putative transcription factor/ chromatin remodeling BED-type(Zn) family [Helianthus anomalus]
MVDKILDNEGDGSKRKCSSGAWSHFTTVEVKEERKMIKKHECMHCKKKICTTKFTYHVTSLATLEEMCVCETLERVQKVLLIFSHLIMKMKMHLNLMPWAVMIE